MIILSLFTMITLKGVWFSSYMFIHVNKCCNLFSTNKPFEWLPFWVNTIVFLYFFYFAAFHCINTLWYLIFFFITIFLPVLHFIWFSERRPCFIVLPFSMQTIWWIPALWLFCFCLYACFVSVVPIFPHKSQKEGLSVSC